MKKLIILAIVAIAAWTAWKKYPELLEKRPSHQAVVENKTGETIVALRLTVAGQTMVAEELPPGGRTTFPFQVDRDSDFRLLWAWQARPGEGQWSGGRVAAGPMVSRFVFTIGREGGVVHHSEPLPESP